MVSVHISSKKLISPSLTRLKMRSCMSITEWSSHKVSFVSFFSLIAERIEAGYSSSVHATTDCVHIHSMSSFTTKMKFSISTVVVTYQIKADHDAVHMWTQTNVKCSIRLCTIKRTSRFQRKRKLNKDYGKWYTELKTWNFRKHE